MKKLLLPAVVSLGALLAACGSSGSTTASGSGSKKDVAIEMCDISFSPTSLTVKKGETVKFTFTNKGAIPHEALIGDDAAQEAHAMEMSSGSAGSSDAMTGMDHGAAKNDVLTVDAGKSGTVTFTFDKSGTVIIGCHEPGHYEAGMKVAVTVT